MNRFFGCVLVVAGITLAFCTQAAAYGVKIGYLDVAGVVAQSNWGKKISADLRKEQEKLASAVQKKKEEFTTARNNYLKKREIMDAAARGRKEQQLESMATQLQKLLRDSQDQWNEEKKSAMEPLFKKIYTIAGRIAKEKKYDLIIDRSALIVVDGKDDITSRVVSELNRESPR